MVIRFRSLFVSLAILAAAVTVAAAERIRDFFGLAFSYIASAFTIDFGGWDGLEPTTGHPLDRATQQFIRHESNYSHRAAARNI